VLEVLEVPGELVVPEGLGELELPAKPKGQ